MIRRSSCLVRPRLALSSSCSTSHLIASCRSIVVYSQQNPASLRPTKSTINDNDNSTFKNMWFEEDDIFHPYRGWAGQLSQLKPGEEDKPTTCRNVIKMLEYYNLDCIMDPDQIPEPQPKSPSKQKQVEAAAQTEKNTHSSSASLTFHVHGLTGKPFHRQDDFAAAATARGYTSKRWVPANEVRKRSLRLVRGSKTTSITLPVTTQLWNISQFQNPEKLAKVPISAYKLRPFSLKFAQLLAKDIDEKKYSSGLYFTAEQMELFNLMSELKPAEGKQPSASSAAAAPPEPSVRINHSELLLSSAASGFSGQKSSSMASRQFYNIGDFEDCEDLIRKFRNVPTSSDLPAAVRESPHYLFSGKPIHVIRTADAMMKKSKQEGHQIQYWVSVAEIQQQQQLQQKETAADASSSSSPSPSPSLFKIKPEAKFVDLLGVRQQDPAYQQQGNQDEFVDYYHVEQLQNPDRGFEVAGSKAMF